MQKFIYTPPTDPLKILFEDQDLIVIDKPSGLLSVPGRLLEHKDSALSRILEHHTDAMAVHRLDMDTSGLMVFALSKRAVSALGKMFIQKAVTKEYIAAVRGEVLDKGQVDLPIRCDLENRPLQIVDFAQGKPSLTLYEPTYKFELSDNIFYKDKVSILKLTPITGRSHQLRLHLASIGHAILADRFYGGDSAQNEAKRLCLHACKLEFLHPFSQESLSFYSQADFLVSK